MAEILAMSHRTAQKKEPVQLAPVLLCLTLDCSKAVYVSAEPRPFGDGRGPALVTQSPELSDGTRRRRGLAVSVVVQPYSASMPQRSSPPVDQGSLIALVESVRTPPQAGFLR